MGAWVRLRIHLPDHPGALQRLSAVIADRKSQHRGKRCTTRAYYGVVLGGHSD